MVRNKFSKIKNFSKKIGKCRQRCYLMPNRRKPHV
jgi:hypothetical protein